METMEAITKLHKELQAVNERVDQLTAHGCKLDESISSAAQQNEEDSRAIVLLHERKISGESLVKMLRSKLTAKQQRTSQLQLDVDCLQAAIDTQFNAVLTCCDQKYIKTCNDSTHAIMKMSQSPPNFSQIQTQTNTILNEIESLKTYKIAAVATEAHSQSQQLVTLFLMLPSFPSYVHASYTLHFIYYIHYRNN